MTLIGAILRKVQSQETVVGKYNSPPPEVEGIARPRKKKPINKYAHVKAIVDSKPPLYDCQRMFRNEAKWRHHALELAAENTRLLMAIRKTHYNRGKVDSHWRCLPPATNIYYDNRVNFLKRVQCDNKALYNLIISTGPQVQSARMLERDWRRNRLDILQRAQKKFVLFPPVEEQIIEDPAFIKPSGVERTRVNLTLRIRGGASLGALKLELFNDVCPETCNLFLELVDGETGFGYVGTCFFRKVPGLFWRGGDVVYDNGFGCYAQRGRAVPIGAENFHFPHSMPGLLSMRVSRYNEVCGSFNITFKPVPQFDLQNVVFGRVFRPCRVFEVIKELGNALSTQPIVEVASAKCHVNGKWRNGAKNLKLPRNCFK